MTLQGPIETIRAVIEQTGPATDRQVETHPQVVAACRSSKTKARRHIDRLVTLAHWAACDRWAAVGQADVDKRVVCLQKRGVPVRRPASIDEGVELTPTPRLGSSPHPSHAGHSQREDSLVHGIGKGWTVDGGRCTGVDAL